MIFIDQILAQVRADGYTAVYGNPAAVNELLTDVDFSASQHDTAVWCYLITDIEQVEGRDRANIGIYFATLSHFDFDAENLLTIQAILKSYAKDLINELNSGNVMSFGEPRYTFGYDDFAENVVWCCVRATVTELAAECIPREVPSDSGCWNAVDSVGLNPTEFSNVIETNGTLSDNGHQLCFTNVYDSRLVIGKTGSLTIHVLPYGGDWHEIQPVDGMFTLQGYPGGTIIRYDWGIN